MNTLLLVFAISLSVANWNPRDEVITDLFNMMDQDRDNVLEPSEILYFLMHGDQNGDGTITKGEFLELMHNVDPAEALRVFYTYDKDHDDVLNWRDGELIFHKLDENGDGHVTLQEMKDNYAETLEPPAIGK